MTSGPGSQPPKAQQILDAAVAVFARLGFGPARMDDVAREAGVSKGGLYLYFKGKDELIDAFVGRLIERETRRITAARAGAGSVEHRLVEFIHGYTSDVVGMKRLAPVVLEAYVRAARHPAARRSMVRFFDAYEAELAELVGQGIETGEFRPVDRHAVAVQITALIEGLSLFWLIDPDRLDLVAMADGGIRLLLDGLKVERPSLEEVR